MRAKAKKCPWPHRASGFGTRRAHRNPIRAEIPKTLPQLHPYMKRSPCPAHTHTDRQTDRQTHTHTHTNTQTERHRHRHRRRHRHRHLRAGTHTHTTRGLHLNPNTSSFVKDFRVPGPYSCGFETLSPPVIPDAKRKLNTSLGFRV